MKTKVVFDVECYPNYFLCMFKNVETGRVRFYEKFNDNDSASDLTIKAYRSLFKKVTCIGFNSINYDALMIRASLSGFNNANLKSLSDLIINSGEPHWIIERKVDINPFDFDHIDIKEPAPGVMVGLKMYGGRIGMPKLQELPISPSEVLSRSQANAIRLYCINDLDTTAALYNAIKKEMALRENLSEKYGLDLRSKSDAQMAEVIFKSYLEKEGVRVGKRQTRVNPFKYVVPDWVHFESEEFNEMLERVRACTFSVNDKNVLTLPKELNKPVVFNGAKYKFGIGGLHSQEKRQVVIPAHDETLAEWDVSGFYPAIIIEQELYPAHLGKKFLDIYSRNTQQRYKLKDLAAKISSELKINPSVEMKEQLENIIIEMACIKIQNNGSYGKFGSVYSFLFSPELLLQTTITGQLSLLMLIEKMTKVGGRVVSANTDGVNVLIKNDKLADAYDQQFDWELTTGYTLEVTPYLATYSRDVNNYIAIKENGIKGKGAFALGGLMKNPTNSICVEAVIAYISENKEIETTILNNRDVTKFLTVRRVTGGAVWRGKDLGATIRFYHSTDGETINYKKNGNKVPKSDSCHPLMDLPEQLPANIDYQWYIDEAQTLLLDLGVNA